MLMEWLEQIDQDFVLTINGIHNPWLDEFMWIVSGKFTLLPLYFLLLYAIWRKTNTKFLWQFILITVITVLVVDQLSVYAFKETFQRYRPSHNVYLADKLHFYTSAEGEEYRGGKFGFVSSHAANMMALLTLIFPIFRNDKVWVKGSLIGVTLLVMFSRIYLGVHYLSDILFGALLGFFIAFFVAKFTIYKFLNQ
jgi:undecaprenyl-diphosphatase